MELVAFVKLDFVEKRDTLVFSLKREEGGESPSHQNSKKKRPKFLTV